MMHYSSISWMFFCCKSKHDKARDVISNWKAKIKRDLDYKPVMELIMRQEGDHLRMPEEKESMTTIFPIGNTQSSKLGVSHSVELNGHLKGKVNADDLTQDHQINFNRTKPIKIDFHSTNTPLE